MPKIKIKIILENSGKKNVSEVIGKINGSIIEYDDNSIKTLIYVDRTFNEVTLKRISAYYHIVMNFSLKEKTSNLYYIKGIDREIPIYIETSYIDITDNKISIKYKQEIEKEVEKFNYTILYEVI